MSFLWLAPMDKSVRADLRRVQEFSRDVSLVTVTILGTIWILFVPWAERPSGIGPAAWWGILILWIGISTVWVIRNKTHTISSIVLSAALFVSITLMVFGTGMRVAPYGFAVFLFMISSILGPISVLIAGSLSVLAVLGVGTQVMGLSGLSLDVLGPIIVIFCATVASCLAVRNLSEALAWASDSIASAWKHAELARDRSADLARALKALDESTYRIERLNSRLTVAVERAREAESIKARFAANISHELRTPLNLVVGFSELLFTHPEIYGLQMSSRCLRDMNTIYRNAIQLQSLVNDVLDLSQIHAARMAVSLESIQLGDLVAETVETVRSLVESKDLSLEIVTESDIPDVMIDPTRIRQVLINLLNNAVRFTVEGSITLRLAHQDDEIIVSVEDTGVGIPENEMSNLFKEFSQLDSGVSNRSGGAGLGLAISKGFVEMHGGRIWAESQVGCGSAFRFTLPVHNETNITWSGVDRTRRGATGRRDVVIVLTRSARALRLLRRYLEGKQIVMTQEVQQVKRLVQEMTPEWLLVDRAALGKNPDEVVTNLGGESIPTLICNLPQDFSGTTDPRIKEYFVKPVANQELQQSLRRLGPSVETILIVDDDRDFSRLIASLLTLPPRVYRVLKAYTAKEALFLLHQSPPDLVLLDLDLPDMSGAEVLWQTRKTPELAGLPVFIITGKIDMAGNGGREVSDNLVATRKDGLNESTLLEWIQKIVGPVDVRPGDESMTLAGGLDVGPLQDPAVLSASQGHSQLPTIEPVAFHRESSR